MRKTELGNSMGDEQKWFADHRSLLDELRKGGQHWANLPEIPGYDGLFEIRRGGQGVVYGGRQRSTDRTVAIKVLLDGGLASEEDRRRFRREVELAARLFHPNIVSVYESGVTAEGLLYYVMEFVEGAPVDEACGKRPDDLRGTLALFATICDAVDYAHQHRIIHRDLKPGNILIDRGGTPHILDFGLAKITAGARDEALAGTTVSRTGRFLGSLAWASPEQIELSTDRLDVRTDVYSLGVVLYQLLTRQLPHAVSDNLREAVERITTVPPRPPRSVRSGIPDDVNTIVMRCLAKEPGRRYPTVRDLGRDIRRFLAGEPIEAKRDRPGYVLRKALGRHKTVTALALVVFLLIVGFAVTMTILYRRTAAAEESARQSLDRTLTQTAKADAVREFLERMLASADPLVSPNPAMTVREMLDTASRQIRARFRGHPELEAEVRSVVGSAYYSLGHLDEAEEHDRRALALLRELHGDDHVEVAKRYRDLGVVLTDRRRFDEAEALLQKALEITRAHLGEDHVQVADCLMSLADLRQGQFRFDEADAHYARASEIYQRRARPEDQRRLALLIQWSSLLLIRGKLEDAEAKLNQVVRTLRAHPDGNDAIRCCVLFSLGMVKYNAKDFESAETLLRRAIRGQRQVFGDRHPRLAEIYNYMGHIRRDQRRYKEAEEWYRKALGVCEKLAGRESADGASSLWNLAWSRWHQGDQDGGGKLFREAIAIRCKLFDSSHHLVQASRSRFAQLLGEAGRWEDALPLLEDVARVRAARYGEKHALTARSRATLGECLAELGRFEEAEALLLDAHAELTAHRKTRPRYVTHVLSALVRLYTRWGKPDRAASYRARLAQKK